MFKKTFFLTMSAFVALTSIGVSCSDNDDDTTTEVLPQEPATVNTNFKFLTINHESSTGDLASLSHVAHDGTVTNDVYLLANGVNMGDKVNDFELIGDKFYLTRAGLNKAWYLDSYIEVMDTASFKVDKVFDFSYNTTQQELNLCTTVSLDNGQLLSMGQLSNDETIHNFALISAETQQLIQSARLDFSVKKMIRVGDKVILGGITYNNRVSKIAIVDVNNPTPEGIRVICDGSLFQSGSPTILKDSKGMIWAAIDDGSRTSVICIDPITEKIVNQIAMPYSVTSLTSVGIAVDHAVKYVYLRAGRAFYKMDANSSKEPEDVTFEITSDVVDGGMSCIDLKMDGDGNLLFIRSIMNIGEGSQVYILNPETWEVKHIYTIGINARYIYIAQ